jgi:glycyl-tRNA synthetase beta subunit
MHPDPKIRFDRLAFLDFINREIFYQVADFSKIKKDL